MKLTDFHFQMKFRAFTRFIGLLPLLPVFALAADHVDVQYNFQKYDFTPAGMKDIRWTPLAQVGLGSTNFFTKDWFSAKTTANGSYTKSNLLTGVLYRVELVGTTDTTTFTNYFGTNVSGLVNGFDPQYLSGFPTNLPGNLYAYSQAASDALYVHNPASKSNGEVLTWDGTNWVAAAGGAGTASAITNTLGDVPVIDSLHAAAADDLDWSGPGSNTVYDVAARAATNSTMAASNFLNAPGGAGGSDDGSSLRMVKKFYPTDIVIYVNTNATDATFNQTTNPYCATVGFALSNAPAGGTVQLTPGQTFDCGGGAAIGLATRGWNPDVTIIGYGATLSKPDFAPMTNNLTIKGATLDYSTAATLGPMFPLNLGPSNCLVTVKDCKLLVYSDGIKNGTGRDNFEMQFDNCDIFSTFQALNNATLLSNSIIRFRNCRLVSYAGAQLFDPGSTDQGTWYLDNCSLAGGGTPLVADATNVVYVNGGSIVSTNGSWAIWAKNYSTIHIRGNPCDRSTVTNDPTATVVWEDDTNAAPVIAAAVAVKAATNSPTIYGATLSNPLVTNQIIFSNSAAPLGITVIIGTNQFTWAGTNVFKVDTNTLFSGNDGGAAGTLKNKAFTNNFAGAWNCTANAARYITNDPAGAASYVLFSATALATNTTLFGNYRAVSDGTTYYITIRAGLNLSSGLTTNVNLLLSGSTTNQLQFSGGILTGIIPQP